MNLNEAVIKACKEKTLLDALSFIAIWESERAIQQALEFNKTKVSTSSEGKCWDTCFKVCFESVIKQWQKESEPEFVER